ncbi:MAG: pitrilysin family protein [Bacteroidales bacterium]|nr:pitrilysin family protein [Bacteroidales bacterium]
MKKQSAQLNRSIAPVPAVHMAMHLDEPGRLALDNGTEVCLIEAGQEEVTRIDLIFNAGSAFQKKHLVAAAANRLLREGTRSHSSFQIASTLDYHGAYLDTSVTKDTAILTLYCLNKYLPQLLPLLSEMLYEPAYPADELQTYLHKQKQEFLTNSSKVKYRAMLGFNSLVFGADSAYGQQLNELDFGLVDISDINSFYQQYYLPENGWILVSGNISKELPSQLNRYFGQYPGTHPDFKLPMVHYADSVIHSGDHLEEKVDALQSAIRIGRPIVGKSHPDFNTLQLLNMVLGGYFGSRLMTNLREEKGFTYGVSSHLVNYRYGGFFSVATEVNAIHTEAALAEICDEIKLLREVPVGEEELSLVKNYLYGTFLRSFDGPFALSDRYISARDHDLEFSYYQKSLATMMQTTSEQLMEAANRYLVPEQMIRLVVGKKEKNTTVK